MGAQSEEGKAGNLKNRDETRVQVARLEEIFEFLNLS